MNKILKYALGISIIVLLGTMMGSAIKFFFRGFHLILTNPLEAFCFFFFLSVIVWVGLETEKEFK